MDVWGDTVRQDKKWVHARSSQSGEYMKQWQKDDWSGLGMLEDDHLNMLVGG